MHFLLGFYFFSFMGVIPTCSQALTFKLYKLAKFLVPILSPLTINEDFVKDSFAFAKKIDKIYHG